jgi:CubicO group peptidase (beta-lactamase class C family)
VDVSILYAAGGLYSTVVDLYKWYQALNSDQLVSKDTLKSILSPIVEAYFPGSVGLSYGYGWVISQQSGHQAVWHNGALSGFNSYMGLYPDDQATIIILSNLDRLNTTSLGGGLAAVMFSGK